MRLSDLADASATFYFAMLIGPGWVEIREATEPPKIKRSAVKGAYKEKTLKLEQVKPLKVDAWGMPLHQYVEVEVEKKWRAPIYAYDGGKILGTLPARVFSRITGKILTSGKVIMLEAPEVIEEVLKVVKVG